MTAPKFRNIDLLREAVAEVRDLDTIEERNIEKDLRNAKIGDKLGTGKEGNADGIQDKVMTKYKATKATVMNIARGMKPADALRAGMKQFEAGQSKHNPDVKSILSDMALNYPHIFNKNFKKKPVSIASEDFETDEVDMVAEDVMVNAILMMKEYIEEETGMELTPEEIAELVYEAVTGIEEGRLDLGKKFATGVKGLYHLQRRNANAAKARKAYAQGDRGRGDKHTQMAYRDHGYVRRAGNTIKSYDN